MHFTIDLICLSFKTCTSDGIGLICSLLIKKKKKKIRFIFAYRKSSLLNYAFFCSLLATSELASKWSYHWILARRSAEDASQQVDWLKLGTVCLCWTGGLVTSLTLQSLQEISTIKKKKKKKICTQYPYSSRIITNSAPQTNPFALI